MHMLTKSCSIYTCTFLGLPCGDLTFQISEAKTLAQKQFSKMYYNHRTHCSHPQHVLVRCQYSSSSGHVCNLCDAGFRGLVGLRCKACDFDIHEACADYFQPAISSFAHPWHGLALGRVADDDRVCDLCAGACHRGGFVYRCVPCGFDLHPLCTMFPAKVRSPLHPEHELAMVPAASSASLGQQYRLCSGCGEVCGGWFYRCDACGVCLHVECLNGARAKQSGGGGSQSTGVGSSQSAGGGSGGGGSGSTGVKRSRSSRVGMFLLKAAVRVAVDAATNGLASAVLDSGGGGADDTSSFDQ